MKSLLILFSFLIVSDVQAFETYFHTTKAKNGDGIYSILRRYHLQDHSCNRQQFLKMNSLELDDQLIVGKEYKLPILIYKYNGTSIRTTVGIDSWEKAVRIKSFNEKILNDKLRKTLYVDSQILWVPFHELNCEVEGYSPTTLITKAGKKATNSETKKSTPSKGNYKNVEYLGPQHKMVEIKDQSLKGKVYYIVSGHGGPDPGAICECKHTMCEDEYAYDVCLRLTRELISHGATAHMIIQDKDDGIRDEKYLDCDKDEFCMGAKIPLNQKRRLEQRASAINNLYNKYKKQGMHDQVAIMVHVDSNTKEKKQDVFFYHHKTSKKSKALAESLQSTFKEKYNYYQKNRGYKGFVRPRGLYMLNNTMPTAAYVELANIRNPNDQERLILNSNREALAKWLFEGIVSYQK